jgi:hypothetical protein
MLKRVPKFPQEALGNLVMALSPMMSALLGLRHVKGGWILAVAFVWLIGYLATNPSELTALRRSPVFRVVLSYVLCLLGATICYVIGKVVSML